MQYVMYSAQAAGQLGTTLAVLQTPHLPQWEQCQQSTLIATPVAAHFTFDEHC